MSSAIWQPFCSGLIAMRFLQIDVLATNKGCWCGTNAQILTKPHMLQFFINSSGFIFVYCDPI